MRYSTTVPEALDLDSLGVDLLLPEDMARTFGGNPIVVGCLVAAGGAAIALVGLAVGVVVYGFVVLAQ